MSRLVSCCVVALLALCGCAAPPESAPPSSDTVAVTPPPSAETSPVPERARVTDLAAFDTFLARHPTPAEFSAAYPGVALVLPGQMATKEMRGDNSRYFAELDAQGRITGGRFQ